MNLGLAWRLLGLYNKVQATWTKEGQGMDGKALVQSKTLWLAVLGTLVQTVPGLAEHMPQPWSMWVLAVLTILNRVFLTKQPITSLRVE